jgi:hypothetical protein
MTKIMQPLRGLAPLHSEPLQWAITTWTSRSAHMSPQMRTSLYPSCAPSTSRSIYLSFFLSIYNLYLSIHPSIHPSNQPFIYLSSIYHLSIIYLPNRPNLSDLLACLSFYHLPVYLSINPSIYQPIGLFIYLPTCLSIYLSIYPSIIYLYLSLLLLI